METQKALKRWFKSEQLTRKHAGMLIREFSMADYAEVVQLWKEAGLTIRPGDEIDGIKLKLQRDPDLFLVAQEESQIVGVVMGAWDGRRGWINHLAVSPKRQRCRIGVALVSELEKRLIRKGARKVNAQIYRSNKKSIAFFKKAGYDVHADLIMVGKMLEK
jgi:ribosomal protein S18 acetylase RimI-like enzyme